MAESTTSPYDKIIGLLQTLIGTQWLLTGAAKILSPGFGNRFMIDVAETIHEARGSGDWYHNAIDVYFVPYASQIGAGVAIFELATGLILLLGAIDWLTGHRIFRHRLHTGLSAVVITLLTIGVFLDSNLALIQGQGFASFNLAGSFARVVPYEFFLIFVSLILIGADLIEMRSVNNQASSASATPPSALPSNSESPSQSIARPTEVPENLLPTLKEPSPPAPPISGFPTTDNPLPPPPKERPDNPNIVNIHLEKADQTPETATPSTPSSENPPKTAS